MKLKVNRNNVAEVTGQLSVDERSAIRHLFVDSYDGDGWSIKTIGEFATHYNAVISLIAKGIFRAALNLLDDYKPIIVLENSGKRIRDYMEKENIIL